MEFFHGLVLKANFDTLQKMLLLWEVLKANLIRQKLLSSKLMYMVVRFGLIFRATGDLFNKKYTWISQKVLFYRIQVDIRM